MIAKEMVFDCKYADRIKKRTHRRMCIKHVCQDYIFKLRATIAYVTERKKHPSMYTGKIV
jgi:hypothetical protein